MTSLPGEGGGPDAGNGLRTTERPDGHWRLHGVFGRATVIIAALLLLLPGVALGQTVSVTGPTGTVTEPATGAAASVVVSVTLSRSASSNLTVTLTTRNGTARAGSDFVGRTGTSSDTVVFPSGTTGPQTFTVSLIGDELYEGDERFTVGISRTTPSVRVGRRSTTVTIRDDDRLEVGFETASHTVTEPGGGGEVSVLVTVTLDRPPSNSVEIPITVLESDAIVFFFDPGTTLSPDASGSWSGEGFPYVSGSLTVTFASGSTTASFSMSVLDDFVYDGGDEFIRYGFGELPPNISAGAIATAEVIIVDDEPVTEVRLMTFGSATATKLQEKDATIPVGIVALREKSRPEDLLSIKLTVSSDSTADTDDYGLPDSLFLAIRPARPPEWFDLLVFDLTLLDNEIVEEDETIVIDATTTFFDYLGDSAPADLPVDGATIVITDDDTATLSVSGPATNVAESGEGGSTSVAFSVTLDGMADQDVTVTLATRNDTATAGEDFVGRTGAASDTVIFAAGTSGPRTFAVELTDDSLFEGDESFGVTVVGVTPDYDGAISFSGAAASATLRDNDPVTVDFVAATYPVNEGSAVVVEVTLDRVAGQTVRIPVTVHAGSTAEAEPALLADHDPIPGSVVFTPGSSLARILVRTRPDSAREGDESVVLGFGTLPSGVSAGAVSMADVVIADDDPAPAVGLSFAGTEPHTVRMTEQDSTILLQLAAYLGRTPAQRTGPVSSLDSDLEITLSVSGGSTADGDDYGGLDLPTVTIGAGAVSAPVGFRFDLVGDGIVEEDESIVIDGETAEGYAFNPMTLVIANDDEAEVSVGGPVAGVDEPAGGESASVVFSVTMDRAADRDVTVTLATRDGTAVAGSDFVGRTGTSADTVVFPAGTTGPRTFTVDLMGDSVFEGSETFEAVVTEIVPDYGGDISFSGVAGSATISAPAVPVTVTAPESGSGTSLSVSWDPPENIGPSPTYEVQYRKSGDNVWTAVAHTDAMTTAMITGLEGGAVYDIRVRAASAETTGDWVITRVRTDAAVNLRLLPRAFDAGNTLTGEDALLLFYFSRFAVVRSNANLASIVIRSLARGTPVDVGRANTHVLRLLEGTPGERAIDRHDANLYKGTELNPSPFDDTDALLMFYSIRFGNVILSSDNLVRIVVSSLVRRNDLAPEVMRAIIETGRNL